MIMISFEITDSISDVYKPNASQNTRSQMKKKNTVLTILTILWLGLIFGHSMMPGEVSSEESGFFVDLIMKLFPSFENAESVGHFVRKAAHFTEFMILGGLLSLRVRDEFGRFIGRFLTASAIGLFAAFIDETIQLFVEGRAGAVADMWIDLAGVVAGCLIIAGITALKHKK